MAILLLEAEALPCVAVIAREPEILMSAGTMAELMIVAEQRELSVELTRMIEGLALTVIEVTEESARRSARAYERWGKGNHGARLNYGDCFAYELAERYGCPLLFVGHDFSKTDVASAL